MESANFAVLINGSPLGFFRVSRGLKQGCPLSPFLFLLVGEGLNKPIVEAKQNGLFRGIQATKSIEVTYLLFVDDILLFGRGNLREQSYLKSILYLFCKATCMEINMNKSCILTNGMSGEQSYLKSILDLFCKATWMEINMNKSCILTNGMSDDFLRILEQQFPMKIEPPYMGFKYLGFHLKPNDYKKDD